MTVTNHTALYRFTFPSKNSGLQNASLPYYPLVSVELTDLQHSNAHGRIAVDNSTGRLSGSGTFSPAFGVGTYNLSFCIDFSGSSLRNTGIWKNSPYIVLPDGAWAQFLPPPSDQLLVRVGVSFMSISKACQNAESEIPLFDFEEVRSAARETWKEKLSVIQIDAEDVSFDIQKLFWSGVYRSMISPQDYSGENPLWNSSEPYYDSYFCIWDTFRTTHPLLTLLDPESQARMVRSLIDIYRFEGALSSSNFFAKMFG
jgi:putative alpha-1,2-mannosidase